MFKPDDKWVKPDGLNYGDNIKMENYAYCFQNLWNKK